MTTIRPLQPRPDFIDEVYSGIRDAIVSGAYGPEQALGQEDLAARLGVSRQPVSHALAMLKKDGLVVERGRRGLMVAPVEPWRILQLYQVRGALDALAAELAAGRVAADAASDTDRMRIADVLSAGHRAVERGDVRALVDADVAFHRCIYDLSGNPAIAEVAAGSGVHVQRSMGVVLSDTGYRARAWDEHAGIVDAVLAGDSVTARERARAHAEDAGRHTFHRLTENQATT